MGTSAIDVVLFDLGGVLVDFGGVGPMRELAHIDSDEELWSRWLSSPWVRRFERGHCTASDFAVGMVNEWCLSLTPERFLQEFESWPGQTMPGAIELVEEVRAKVPIGCLSNTNALHWDAHFSQWPILHGFDYRFLSFELGAVKPDAAIFAEVAQRLGIDNTRVLFIDDNVINVDAAHRAGFQAAHARGVPEARQAVCSAGILSG